MSIVCNRQEMNQMVILIFSGLFSIISVDCILWPDLYKSGFTEQIWKPTIETLYIGTWYIILPTTIDLQKQIILRSFAWRTITWKTSSWYKFFSLPNFPLYDCVHFARVTANLPPSPQLFQYSLLVLSHPYFCSAATFSYRRRSINFFILPFCRGCAN